MLHIPPTNCLLLTAKQEQYKKAYLLTKNTNYNIQDLKMTGNTQDLMINYNRQDLKMTGNKPDMKTNYNS